MRRSATRALVRRQQPICTRGNEDVQVFAFILLLLRVQYDACSPAFFVKRTRRVVYAAGNARAWVVRLALGLLAKRFCDMAYAREKAIGINRHVVRRLRALGIQCIRKKDWREYARLQVFF